MTMTTSPRRNLTVLAAASLSLVVVALQQNLPRPMASNADALKSAAGLLATVKVVDLMGTTEEYKVEYAKPNFLRIDNPTTQIVSDGKTLTILDKAANTYTQVPCSQRTVVDQATLPGVWGWAWFFESDATKLIRSATTGSTRTMRGVAVSEATAILTDGRTTATLFVENSTGVVRGFSLKSSEKSMVIWADEIKLLDKAPSEADFAFVAPAGATLAAATVAAKDANWATVSSLFGTRCMPCHSAERRSAGLDLTNYNSVAASPLLVRGNAADSVLVRSIKSGSMPKNRPKLKETEIAIIEAWVNNGMTP